MRTSYHTYGSCLVNGKGLKPIIPFACMQTTIPRLRLILNISRVYHNRKHIQVKPIYCGFCLLSVVTIANLSGNLLYVWRYSCNSACDYE